MIKGHSFLSFNTSHVTLYRYMLWASFIYSKSFNTSHVTLYLKIYHKIRFLSQFQYIPCYSLSEKLTVNIWLITCFNTSHVTLYLFSFNYIFTPNKGFNTSHVTLYLLDWTIRFLKKQVSIHPMLLFIPQLFLLHCCIIFVSIHPMLLFIKVDYRIKWCLYKVSIHPMLLFIG